MSEISFKRLTEWLREKPGPKLCPMLQCKPIINKSIIEKVRPFKESTETKSTGVVKISYGL